MSLALGPSGGHLRSEVVAEGWDWPEADPDAFVQEIGVAGGSVHFHNADDAD